jgi:hypothetical protein
MLTIGVESEYRSIARSLSGFGPKGELKAPIAAGSEVANATHDRSTLDDVVPVCELEV